MRICAIHQPNFLPRLSTLAKLFAADVWVTLDDVQYNGRDYQNRCRLATIGNPHTFQWLSLPVHRPHGRVTEIRDVRLVDQRASYHRTTRLLRQYYRSTPHWTEIDEQLRPAFDTIVETNSLAAVATSSTLALLRLLGWRGDVVSSSALSTRNQRSERLADLVRAVEATSYLCGTGGRRYLDVGPFVQHGLTVRWFQPPTPRPESIEIWTASRRLSALWSLAQFGPDAVRERLNHAKRETKSSDPFVPMT